MLDARRVIAVEDDWRVRAALRDLDLTPETLRGALEAGHAAAAACTPNHPPNFGGIAMWAETVRSLREQLAAEGWYRDDADNFSTVVRKDGALGIAVASGNADTGKVNGHPATRHSKGPITHQVVERNAFLPFKDMPKELTAPAPKIWVLLHNRTDGELRSELSFPVAVDESGYVTAWGTRLVLTPLDLGPGTLRLDDDPVVADVEIRRL